MQAGESLNFISMPDELARVESQADEERAIAYDSFSTLVHHLLSREDAALRVFGNIEERGPVGVVESSSQVLFGDGSYLHLSAYGHYDDEGFLDLGLSISEHSDQGVYFKGFLYELTPDEVRYSKHYDNDADEDSDEAKFHFSVVDQYEHSEELYEIILTGDQESRREAEVQLNNTTQATQLNLMERELGFSWAQPTLEDIRNIEALAAMSSPFPIDEHTAQTDDEV